MTKNDLEKDASLARLMSSVSNRFGIVRGFARRLTDSGGVNLSMLTSVSGNHRYLGGAPSFSAGAAANESEAVGPTLGEALERYAYGFSYKMLAHKNKSRRELVSEGHQVLEPARCNLFSEAQYRSPSFNLVPYTDNLNLSWFRGQNLITEQDLLVPADYIYAHEPRIFLGNTTGIGSGPSVAAARLSGLLEVIERDGFCFSWLTKTPAPRLDLESLPKDLRETLGLHFGAILKNVRISVALTDLEIPILIATYRSSCPSKPRLSVAAAAHLDPAKALLKSLFELALCLAFIDDQIRKGLPTIPPDQFDSSINDFVDGVNLYAGTGTDQHRDILVDPRITIKFSEIPSLTRLSPDQAVTIVTERLNKINATPVSVDLTTRDLRVCGQYVTKIVIPELIQLSPSHHYRTLSDARLKKLRALWRPENPTFEFNLDPHPFP